MAHPYWPLFNLRIRTPRLELRLPTDPDLVELAALAARGIHPPDEMPFTTPFTDRPSPELERGLLQWHWSRRGTFAPEDWWMDLVVSLGGTIVGVQALFAKQFPLLRVVHTGSWLGRAHQGQGVGREMRAAILHLAFTGLGAVAAFSDAYVDNPASRRVSESLAYRPNGSDRQAVRGIAREVARYRLDRADWQAAPRVAVELDGLDACLPLFGLGT